MEVFAEYISNINIPEHRARLSEIFDWIIKKYPNLVPKIAWNQPVFTDHETYIIGFSVSKQHLAVAPEIAGIERFSDEIIKAGYESTKSLFRIKWDSPVDFFLLAKIIGYNISDKANCTTFWRK